MASCTILRLSRLDLVYLDHMKMTVRCASRSTMRAWQAYGYGGPEQLRMSTTAVVPAMSKPTDMLIEIHAASVNPMDSDMLGGYGSKTFEPVQKMAGSKSQFPITFGRDFSGVVVDTAQGLSSKVFKPGDEIWGVTNPLTGCCGTHADYMIASASESTLRPLSLSHIDAASFPYVVCTAWSAITKSGGITHNNAEGKRILIVGASGGVGTFAVQLLKAWGAQITAICGTDAIEKVIALGADVAVDYKIHNVQKELQNIQGFDLILDCVKNNPEKLSAWMRLLKSNSGASYVTLNSPLLRNNDNIGFPFGFVKSALDFGPNALKYKTQGKNIGWGLFYPSKSALKQAAVLIDEGKIQPVIEKIYSFNEVPEAFRKVGARHGRGKCVIDVKS